MMADRLSRAERLLSRSEKLYLAKVAEKADLCEDLLLYMEDVIVDRELLPKERERIAKGFSKKIATVCKAYRYLSDIRETEAAAGHERNAELLTIYLGRVIGKIEKCCKEAKDYIKKKLFPMSTSTVETMNLTKMIGDCYLQFAETVGTPSSFLETEKAYGEAWDFAIDYRLAYPDVLRLALKKSNFNFKVQKSTTKACEVAAKAICYALEEVEEIDSKTAELVAELAKCCHEWKQAQEDEQA